MVRFKGYNEVVLTMLEQLQMTQPQLDTKPASVARDLFIDAQAQQVSDIGEQLREIEELQSIANMSGEELTNFGFNFGVTRQSGTRSNGTVLFTFQSITSDTIIVSGTVTSTRNGIMFLTISTVSVLTSDINSLRATATRFREELDAAGITDQYAIEVSVQAQNAGSIGNISSYSIVNHSAPGVNGVTNIDSFSGGSDLETDAAFRSRVLARFAGANTGTALGYRSLVLALSDTVDALVVEPGDPLMTRDGSVVTTNSDGELVVAQPGTGGKVDIFVMGENLQSGTDSFIYKEQSGTGDPTNSLNNYILGQSSLSPDESLTISTRRLAVLSEGQAIPLQPVSSIVSVSGSSSGSGFAEQYEDDAGVLHGNYKLVKDTGSAAGSPFGFDKLVWTSDQIDLEDESRVKGPFNGIDALSFSDVQKVSGVSQDTRVTNENSRVSSADRSSVYLTHGPVRTVSRVYNFTTGERYTVSSQNPDGTSGELNESRRITISGRTLPTASDVLQVDYVWARSADPGIDFDTMYPEQDLISSVQDSIDWGFPNYIRAERTQTDLDSYGNLTATVTYAASRVMSVNSFREEMLVVQSGATAGRKSVETTYAVTNVYSAIDADQNQAEVFNTNEDDGTFSNRLITLPSDTLAEIGDQVTVTYSLSNLIDEDGYGSAPVRGRVITILPSDAAGDATQVLVHYVADFLNLVPQSSISGLPISGDGYNSFSGIDGYQPVQDLFSGPDPVANMRRSPSRLEVSVSGIPDQGLLEIAGTTFTKITSVFTATADDSINLVPSIRSSLGLASGTSLPVGVYLGRVVSIEKVQTDIYGNVTSVDHEFDMTNYTLWSNRFDLANARQDTSLGRGKVSLADVGNNTSSPIVTGTQLRAVFYYANQGDSEQLFFSKSGAAITDKVFAKIGSISRISGFANSAGTISGSLSVDSLNQPDVNASYLASYSYTAPKENERITVNYEYNKLIQDATYAVEDGRPITADVLNKESTQVEVDVEATIIVLPAYAAQEETVRQNVADNIASSLTASALGTTIDASDVSSNAYSVEGLDRITIDRFNKSESSGTVKSLAAQKNENFVAGSVAVTVESR